MWFETLTGFREETPGQIRDCIVMNGDTMTSKVNGQTYRCGRLETPTLGKLRTRVEQVVATGNTPEEILSPPSCGEGD